MKESNSLFRNTDPFNILCTYELIITVGDFIVYCEFHDFILYGSLCNWHISDTMNFTPITLTKIEYW